MFILTRQLLFETSTHRLMRQEKASNVFFYLKAPPPFVCLPWVDTGIIHLMNAPRPSPSICDWKQSKTE